MSFPESAWKCVMDVSTNSYPFWKISSSLPTCTSEACSGAELVSQCPTPHPQGSSRASRDMVIGKRQTTGAASCVFPNGEVRYPTHTLPSGMHGCSFQKYLLLSIQVHSLLVFLVEFPIPVAS